MRLSFLCHEFPPVGGGASTALDHLTKVLAKRGNEVQVVTIGLKSETTVLDDSFSRRIVYMAAGRRSLLAPSTFELLRSYLALRSRSRQYVEDFKPDVINAFFAFPAGRAAVALGQSLKLPVAVSLRGSDVPGFSGRRWGVFNIIHPHLVRKVWRKADRLLANGAYLSELAKSVYSGRPVINIPNGVDCDLFHKNPGLECNEQLNILFVGQLIERKRCLEMMAGIQWAAEVGGLRGSLTVVGDGPLRSRVAEAARRMPPSIEVNILGACERAQLPEIYRRHNVLLHLSKAEGVSNVILEAMASGVAVVTSDAEYSRAQADTPAIVLPDAAQETVGRVLLELAGDMGKLRSAGVACRKYAETRDWDHVAKQYEDIVRCLSPSRGGTKKKRGSVSHKATGALK